MLSLERFERRLALRNLLICACALALVFAAGCSLHLHKKEAAPELAAAEEMAAASSESATSTAATTSVQTQSRTEQEAGLSQPRDAGGPQRSASTTTLVFGSDDQASRAGERTGLEKELSTGDKLLFTPRSKPPRPGAAMQLQERETWPYLTLEDAPIEEVLEMFMKIMPERGTINYIVDPSVKSKKITTRFWRPVRPENLWFILQSILTMNGLAMIDTGRDFYKIVPLPSARQLPVDTFVGKSGDHLQLEDRLVTQIIPTQHIAPSALLKLIKPFLSSVSYEIASDDTGLLIVTDLAANIKRVMTFVKLLDVPTATEELKVFPIRYADAAEVASVLDKLFTARARKMGGGVISGGRRRTKRGSRAAARTSSTIGGVAEKPVIITDKRSNSLIILGRKAALHAAKTIIDMLDVDVYATQKTYVYYLENAEAKSMASLLNTLYSKSRTTRPGGSRSTKRGATPFSRGVRSGSKRSAPTGTITGDVSIVADENTNSLIIVTDPANYPEIESTIKALDIPPKQVLIEVLIAELTLDKTTQFGLEWALKGQGSAKVLGEDFNVMSDIAQALQIPSAGGFVLSVVDARRLRALLNAYANQSKLNVLSTPRIIASNNQEAKIYVGKDVPIVTSEVSSTATAGGVFDTRRTIQYKDTGIILTVTPHVNEKRKIKLEISQTVSEAQTNKIGGSDSPIVNRREVKTTVMVDDKKTLLIGGLIKKNLNTAREGIPVLMDIPYLGRLFSSTSVIQTSTELLILLTPRVIDTTEEGSAALRDYEDEMRQLFREIRKRQGTTWEHKHSQAERPSISEKVDPSGKKEKEDKGN